MRLGNQQLTTQCTVWPFVKCGFVGYYISSSAPEKLMTFSRSCSSLTLTHTVYQYIDIFFLISVLALLQPALFILSQMDLGPLASVQYFGGFISADFRQTLLSLKLKCLFSFSKFSKCQLLPVTISQNWCICCSSSCCISTRTMRHSKPKAEVEPMQLV